MMKSLLANLKVRTKMSIAAFLLLGPLVFLCVQFFRSTAGEIQGTKAELRGIEYTGPLQGVLYHTQRRRGFVALHSATANNTDAIRRESEAAKKFFQELEAVRVNNGDPFKLETELGDLKTKFGYLLDTTTAADKLKHVALHTEFNRYLLELIATISERSTLDLEPEAGPYYLMELSLKILTPVGEVIGQTRALGTSILTNQIRDIKVLNDLAFRFGIITFRAGETENNRLRVARAFPAKKPVYEPLYNEANKLNLEFQDIRTKLFNGFNIGGVDSAQTYFDVCTRYIDAFYQLEKEATRHLKELLQARLRLHRLGQILTMTIALIATCFAIGLGWLIIRQISQSLEKAMAVSENLAAGNLEFTVVVDSGDEIGAFMKSLQIMSERLKGVLRQVHQSASEITLAAQQVASTAEMLNNGAMDQAAHVEETGAALGEMVNLIGSNAKNAIETDNTASAAYKNTQIGADNVMRAVDSMKIISERITIVQEIASQTNLLALNATIEAARAGEHGRGFAVVATEVGKLADTSGQAAKQIQALLKESSAVSESAASSLSLITASMQDTAQKVVAIRHASQEQDQAAKQISESMGRLNQTTEQTASAAEQLAATAEEMSSQTATLIENLKFFRFTAEEESFSHNYSAANAIKRMAARETASVKPRPSPVPKQGTDEFIISSGEYEKF
jgi:methyl-accepting chemotaxis protein